jgi:nucleoid-associated protein YgaU
MSNIVYAQEVYNAVSAQKTLNEQIISDLYNEYPSMQFSDKLVASELINELKKLNDEYTKYMLIYSMRVQSQKTKNDYIIIEGDTLPRIAAKTLGDQSKWQEIYNYNNLQDLLLVPGDVLKIPEVR